MPGNQNVKTELRLMLSIKSYWQNTAAVYISEFREMSYRAAHRFFLLQSFYSVHFVSDQPLECLMVFKHQKNEVHVAIL